jgi:hypothetical protein
LAERKETRTGKSEARAHLEAITRLVNGVESEARGPITEIFSESHPILLHFDPINEFRRIGFIRAVTEVWSIARKGC